MSPYDQWLAGKVAYDVHYGGTIRFKSLSKKTGNPAYERHAFMGKPHTLRKRSVSWCKHQFDAGFWELREDKPDDRLRQDRGRLGLFSRSVLQQHGIK